MAVTQPVLAGTTLPYPSAFRESATFRGTSTEMADGSQTTQLVQSGAKRTFVLTWNNITSSDKATIITAYTAIKSSSGSFTSPDSTVYTVTRDGDNELEFTYTLGANATFVYSCSLSLREA